MTMTLIETITVGVGGAASIEFTGIPSTGVDLMLLVSAIDPALDYKHLVFNLNNDELNLSSVTLRGTGSSVSTFTSSGNATDVGIQSGTITVPGNTANTPASYSFYISNYAGSSAKAYSVEHAGENNATLARMSIIAGKYDSTSAVTAVKLQVQSSTFSQYSAASLYIIS